MRRPASAWAASNLISSGRASAALTGLRFRKSRWGAGIYDGPALLRTKLVVVSELVRTRDTLLVRIMGAGGTLKRAIVDLWALPPDAPERLLALPILVRLSPRDPRRPNEADPERSGVSDDHARR